MIKCWKQIFRDTDCHEAEHRAVELDPSAFGGGNFITATAEREALWLG